MRVAFVVSNLTYPPREGLHQLTLLTAQIQISRGDEVHLLGFCRDLEKLDIERMANETGLRFHAPPIRSRLPSVMLGLVNRFVPTVLRGRAVRNLQAALSSDYDIVHLENTAACGLVRRGTSSRTILGLIDPGPLRWRRLAATASNFRFKLKARLGIVLNDLLAKAIAFPGVRMQLVSETDASYLQTRLTQVRVVAIPIALPMDIERPPSIDADSRTRQVGVVFMDLSQPYLRNSFIWFIRSVYRPLFSRGCSFDLVVLGRISEDSELAKLCQDLPVTFLAWVDDYLALLAGADFIITPDLVGTGLKTRVIQGMALGRPVVGTPAAFEGIPALNGVHAVIANTADEMITALISLCDRPELRKTIGEKAQELAIEKFGTESIKSLWRDLYDSVMDATKPSKSGHSRA
jgi:glycosyltransferase involved in cell wall biosynthesis